MTGIGQKIGTVCKTCLQYRRLLFQMSVVGVVIYLAFLLCFISFERPPVATKQLGYRGLGLQQVDNPRLLAKRVAANQLPEAIPAQEPSGQKSSEVYENVQVLKDVDSDEFLRLMAAITAWVSPEQGCAYCHVEESLASDKLYTKVVARRMLQMTQNINANWKPHVAETGVTCYTCHRGQPVPQQIWFTDPGPSAASGAAADRQGKNAPSKVAGLSSLQYDPLTPYLDQAQNIRVISKQALPGPSIGPSIKDTEATYALMFHMSGALGVNCTFCHNSRSFFDWEQSAPQRVVAWHGIRMVRQANNEYLEPLKGTFPHERLGPLGDVPKVSCATCHQGVNKPLLGQSMVKDFPELTPAAAK